VALSIICDQITPMLKPLLEKYQVTLQQGDSSGYHVMADPVRLRQVMLNLVSNAIKFNRPGGRADVRYETVEGNRLRLSVSDTGVGIEPERQALLFRPFERLGVETTRVEGVGLGLAFSKRLVELMHGEIGLDSVPGEGSTFWVTLPLATSQSDQESNSQGERGSQP